MSATTASLVDAAHHEWDHWGQSTWNLIRHRKAVGHTDDEEDFAQYVIDIYCSVAGGEPSVNDIADDNYAWSAVCLSAIMANGGYTKREFPFAQSHSVYLRRFIRARKQREKNAAYWGFRIRESAATPDVGDLIGCARGAGVTFSSGQAFYDKTGPYMSHSDLVVAKRADEIDVIGGNVLDSVTRKTLALDENGLLADRNFPWFVVLKRRAEA